MNRPIILATVAATMAFASQLAPVAAAPQTADTARGATLFQQRCAMCHVVNGKGGKVGPDLTRIVGRKAGSGSFAYSPAMKASKTVWNAGTLDTYLTAPMKMIPGSRMAISVSKPEDRKAIVAYLATAR